MIHIAKRKYAAVSTASHAITVLTRRQSHHIQAACRRITRESATDAAYEVAPVMKRRPITHNRRRFILNSLVAYFVRRK